MPTQKQLSIKTLFRAAALTTTTTGTGVDLQGSINPGGRQIKAFLDVSSTTGTTPSVTVKIQESDDNSSYADISGATFTVVTTTTGNTLEEIHFRTNKRYVRAVATYTANTTSATFGCFFISEGRAA